MSERGGRPLVVLGMITKMPVPGVLWQTLHYLIGFRRLGYDPWYVEAHARTPSMFARTEGDPGSGAAAVFLSGLMARFGFGDRWAFHALHDDGACYGLDPSRLARLYDEAEILINLHGGTRPLPEHTRTGRLVFVGTDPVQLEVELWQGQAETFAFLEAHCAAFTFGENYGHPDCGLPVSDRFTLHPTRQPVVLDFWEHDRADGGCYSTVANWRQPFRRIRYRKEIYHWSKDLEFRKVLDLPGLTGRCFELALASYTEDDRRMLEERGWSVRPAEDFGLETERYRDFVCRSRGEFTVAKDQNVRLRSGWFSDRSATYLAAGRPVVTQETGFSNVLPTGHGLFGFDTLDEAVAAVESIERDYPAACRAAADIAREFFDYRVVLPRLLTDLGVTGPARATPAGGDLAVAPSTEGTPLPDDLVLEPLSRRPLRLDPETMRTLADRPTPAPRPVEIGGARPAECSVIVVTHGGLPLTRLCLETLLASGDDPPFEVIVVDNGSSDGTPAWLRALAAADPRVRPILNEPNEGFARACNQGARAAAPGSALVFLNNDTVLAPGWLAALLAHLDDPTVGAVNPSTNRSGTEAEVRDAVRTWGEFVRSAAERRRHHAGERRPVSMLALFCMAIRREVWERVGPLDESYGRGLFEDDDYSLRLEREGLELVCAEDVLVHHLGEASFGELVPDGTYGRLFEENRHRFETKWGRRWSRRSGRSDRVYGALVKRIRSAVDPHVPDGATIAVVSRGDEALLRFEGAHGWHFPRNEQGAWAGHYPADGAEAVRHLEALRRQGARYLLIPRPGFWWLDHYEELRHYLNRDGSELMRTDDAVLYRLGEGETTETPRPILIIGSPRSGTSILTWALGQHPNVYPLEETVWFGRFHRGLEQGFTIGSSRGDLSQLSAMGITRERFMQAFGRTADALIREHRVWPERPVRPGTAFARARRPDDPKERWVDGTPENSFFVPGLAELFPEARFIHLLREPRAVVRSLRSFHRAGGRRHEEGEAWSRWLRTVRACVRAERDLGPERVLRVYHRDLASSPEELLRVCLRFVGESFHTDCLLPLGQRINSSGTAPPDESDEGEPADPAVVEEALALETELFREAGQTESRAS